MLVATTVCYKGVILLVLKILNLLIRTNWGQGLCAEGQGQAAQRKAAWWLPAILVARYPCESLDLRRDMGGTLHVQYYYCTGSHPTPNSPAGHGQDTAQCAPLLSRCCGGGTHNIVTTFLFLSFYSPLFFSLGIEMMGEEPLECNSAQK
jgi:hypothetical protein